MAEKTIKDQDACNKRYTEAIKIRKTCFDEFGQEKKKVLKFIKNYVYFKSSIE